MHASQSTQVSPLKNFVKQLKQLNQLDIARPSKIGTKFTPKTADLRANSMNVDATGLTQEQAKAVLEAHVDIKGILSPSGAARSTDREIQSVLEKLKTTLGDTLYDQVVNA